MIFKKKTNCLSLGGTQVPRELETLHMLLAGTTGTGKSTACTELIEGIIGRDDGARLVCIDPGGEMLSRYFVEGDKILNPFDARSESWSIFNEIRKPYDCDRLAKSIVPDGVGADATWHHYAQVLLAETLSALLKKGEGDTERLIHWISCASSGELKDLLKGTAASGLFDENASKALASTKFVATSHLAPHKYLKPGSFSLRDWLSNDKGNLYITWREDMSDALKPLIGCFVDVIATTLLSLNPGSQRRVFLMLDELPGLGKVNSLESCLVRGRKFGIALIAAIQSSSQLDYLYGREKAASIRSCFRNLLIFGGAKTDPESCELWSRALGESERDTIQYSRNDSMSGPSSGQTIQRSNHRLVMPSEIAELPNLEGILALAGDHSAKRIKLKHSKRASIFPPLMEDE